MAYKLLQDNAFYHGTIRRFITTFLTLFQGIQIRRLNADGSKNQIIEVPIEYGPKNKWMEINKERPDYEHTIEMNLPRLSAEITDYRYDANRKIGTKGSYTVGSIGDRRAKVFNPVPYDVYINLYSITKDQNDALQILEQVLPYFSPSLTVSMTIIPEFNIVKDVPIVLSSVNVEDNYEGSPQQFRNVIQTFSFVAQLDLFGPINAKSAIIKHAQANVTMNVTNNLGATYNADVNPDTSNKEDTNYVIDERWQDF